MVPAAAAPEVVHTPTYSRELLLSALAAAVEPATVEREASATPPPLFTIQMRKGGGGIPAVPLKAAMAEAPAPWPPPPPLAPPAVGVGACAGAAEPPPPPSQAVPDSPPRKVPGLRVEAPEFVPLQGAADQAAEPKPLRTPLCLAATIADPGMAKGSSTPPGPAATPKSPACHSAAASPPPPPLWPGLAPWPGQSPAGAMGGMNSLFTAAAAAAAATAVVAAGFAAAAQQCPSTPGRQQPPAGWPSVEAATAVAACPDAKASPSGNASRKRREEPPKTPLTGRGKVLSLDEHVGVQSPAAHKVGAESPWAAWGPMMSPGGFSGDPLSWFPQGSPTASADHGPASTPGGLAGLLGASPTPHAATNGLSSGAP